MFYRIIHNKQPSTKYLWKLCSVNFDIILESEGSDRKLIKYVKPERKNQNDIKPEVIG